MANPLINITIELYFEISDGTLFGGKGSVGYMAINYEECENIESIDDSFIDRQKELVAKASGALVDDIKLISKEEYEDNTEDCEV